MSKVKLQEVIRDTLSELSGISRASDNTIQAYENDLTEFSNFCAEQKIDTIDQISERVIRRFVMKLNSKELSKSSVSRKLSTLRRMFGFALRNEIIDKNPIKKIPNPKVKRKLPETINLDSFLEIYRLIDKDKNSEHKNRNKAILELLYGCALRVSELCGLNIGDVDLNKKQLRVLGKGSKVRIVPIGNESIKIIRDYFQELSDRLYSDPLFYNDKSVRINRFEVYVIVKKYINDVSDIEKKSPHILRHSAATHMLDRDADIMAVKEILGHENLSTTQIYTHVSIERLKKSYKKAHPKS
ncbi:MAG: tyrosine-type recombinase/integrase [Bacteroidota bacterium]